MKAKFFFGAFALVSAAVFATNLVADGYDEDALAHYMRLFARSTPSKAQLGVDVYPRSIFRKESSAENMSQFLPGNAAGRPPAVYHVEFYVPRGDYAAIVAHYSKFADPATSPVESIVAQTIRRTTIELARDGSPKQRIIVYDRTDGHGCTQSSIDEEGQGTGPCVLVHIVSRGEASWAAAGRGQPRPVTQQAAPKTNNRSTNTASNSNSNNNSNTSNNNSESERQQNCERAAQTGQNVGSSTGNNAAYAVGGDWRAAAAGRAIGGLLGRATAKKSNNNCQ